MPRKTAILYSKRVNSMHLVIKLLTNIHQVKHYTLMGRLYRYDEGKPFFYKVITQDDQQVKLEQAGIAFRENSQIHYFRLALPEGSNCHKFQLSCNRGSTLPTNQTLKYIGCRKTWRGDIFVMRIGKRDPKDLVNMGDMMLDK